MQRSLWDSETSWEYEKCHLFDRSLAVQQVLSAVREETSTLFEVSSGLNAAFGSVQTQLSYIRTAVVLRELYVTPTLLYWETATEIDSDRFEIYFNRVADFSSAQQIGQVDAIGDPALGSSYEFELDVINEAGFYFLWLREVEVDEDATLYGPVHFTQGTDRDIVCPSIMLTPNGAAITNSYVEFSEYDAHSLEWARCWHEDEAVKAQCYRLTLTFPDGIHRSRVLPHGSNFLVRRMVNGVSIVSYNLHHFSLARGETYRWTIKSYPDFDDGRCKGSPTVSSQFTFTYDR